ncbi:MAG: hypothetical protein HFE86_04550, partial [Clostridiales bacterium]|nr:hypothetical protein [Clostridiales bacterium]
MSKKHEAKSSKRVVASLLAAGMVLTMLPLGALTASAKPGVDDVLSADRPTAYNWLTPYVDLDSVSAKTAANTKEAGLKGNEDPWMIFDGKTSTKMGIMKEHNGTEKPHDHVEIAWAMTEQVTLEHYTLGSGNDSFGRDPKAWTLSASNDEGEEKVYTPISTVENANLNWWDNSLYSSYYPDDYAIENPAPYKYYKIEFTDYRGYEQYFQFSEFVMSGTAASQNNNPIRYEMENLIDDGKVAKSDEAIVLNSGSTDASPSGGKYAQIALKADGNYVTCSLDNIPTSGLYRVSMAVKGNEQSATVALGKDYAKDPANIGPRFVPSAPAFQLNTFGADVPKVTGEFWLHAGTDTIDIVGLANCGANIRPDYIELQKISDYSVRTDLSVANAAGKVTADDGITLATSTDNSSPWGGNINMFWVKKGAADKSVTASVDVPAPGTYQMYVTYKSRETSNQMKVSVNETEVGTIDCYAAGNGSDKVSRSRKYFEPLVGTFTADAAGPANVVFTFASDEHQDANDGAVFVPSEIILVPLDTEPVTPPALDATLPDSAVVHYTFDDGAKDASDNANDGVVTNVDIAGGIATFAGDKNSNIKIESPVMKHANVTVSTMIKVDEQPATWATLWEAYSNNGNQLVRFAINNDNGKDVVSQFRTVKEDGSGTASKLSSGNTKMPVGEWTELTVVAEGVTAILYINGEEVARVSKPNTPMLFSDLQDEGVTYLGHEAKWGDATFKGQMSDFRVYDTALNAVQVAALYAENLKEVTPDPYAELSKEAAAVARQIDALPETTTHRQGPAYRDIKAAFDALTADQKVELGDERAAKLTQVGADLDALYEAFNVTIKKAYPGGNMDKTPWMKGDGLTEEQKEAVYQSVEDEIRYQYVERGFLLRDTDSECELGDWNNRVNLTLENGEDSDNVGRPADWAGQKWSCVNAPFVGVAFSQNGIFGVKAIDEPAISDAFEYNGRIYLVTTSKTASYKAGLDLSGKTELLPKDIDDNDDFYGYERLENYPGKGRIDWGDITKNTFSYAFALYNQEHKRENKVVGIPVAGEYVKEIEGMKYQRFEGPQGIAYIAASNEAINAAETQNGVKEGAYVIIGEMARALESLGENAEAWFAKTGAPVAKAVTAAGATTQKFANGTLKAQNGKYSFVSDVDLQAIAAVEAKITAAADIASIDTLTDLEAKIAEAKEAYGALDASLQAAVSNLSKLDELDQAVENVKAAERLFTDMTAADAVTEENVADVRAELTQARAAKDALKAYAKFISAAADEKYAAVYQAVSAFVPADEDIASAEELIDAIGVIPDDNTTYKSAPAVYAAKAAYDALSADQQALVNATKKAALEEAVTKMEELAESVKETIYGNVSDDTNRWDNSMDPGVW